MNTNIDPSVDAIRLAWGIGISQAEADSAACVIENRKLLRPDKPESYWSRALRNLMLDFARHSKVRKHAVLEILYPRMTGRGNYVEDALIESIDARRRSNLYQEIQINNILTMIVKVAGQIEHLNTSQMTHDAFVSRLLEQKKLSALRLRSSLRFTNPSSRRTLLTVQATTYHSWPHDHHELTIKRSAVSVNPCDEMVALPRTIHCYLNRDPVPEGAVFLEL